MATIVRPRIVVAGPSQSGKRSLVSGVLRLNRNATTAEQDVEQPTSSRITVGQAEVDSYPLSLSTKYYDAELDMVVLPASEFAEPSAAATEALDGAEAVILVLDARSHDSLITAAAWPPLLQESTASCLLCVVNHCDTAGGAVPGADGDDGAAYGRGYGQGYGSIDAVGEDEDARQAHATRAASAAAVPREHRTFLSSVQDWCLDVGFEAVECSAIHPTAGAHARDKVGVARVLEALQSTMWSNMQRKQPPGHSALGAAMLSEPSAGGAGGQYEPPVERSAAAQGSAEEAHDAQGSSLAAEIAAMRAQAAVARGDVFPEAAGSSAAPAQSQASSQPVQAGAAGSATSAPVLTSTLPDNLRALEAASDLQGDDEDDEGGMDIGALMAQMMAVRQAAVAGGLSDDQRREAAANMAMRLLQLMGEDGDPAELLRAGRR